MHNCKGCSDKERENEKLREELRREVEERRRENEQQRKEKEERLKLLKEVLRVQTRTEGTTNSIIKSLWGK